MADIQKTVSIIFSGVNNTGNALGGITSGLDGLGKEASDATGKVNELDKEVDSLSDKGGKLDTVIDGFKALAAAIVVKEFIDANIELERFNRAMTQITGSTEEARQEFEYIRVLSNTLGLSVREAADAYVQLSAATKGTALEGQQTREIYEAVSIAMSSLGRSTDDTQGALLAISQIVSKGTVSMEELRGQLGERLPGAFQLAAKSMGLTTQQLDDLVSSGNLAATEFLPKFAQALKDTYGDVSYIEGFEQSMNRLQNSLQDAYQQIGQTGAFDALTKGIQLVTASVTGAVSGVTALGEIIGAVAGALATGNFSGLGEAVDAAMTKAAQKTRGARDALLGLNEEIKTSGNSGANAGAAIADGMDKGAQGATNTKAAAKELDAALKSLGIDPKQFKDPLDEILKAFEALAKNPAVTGDQFLAGFIATLNKVQNGPEGISSLERIVVGLDAAQKNGSLTTAQYTQALELLEKKTSGNWQTIEQSTTATNKNAEALKKQAAETQKAEEAAQRMRLELEKLASNERIAQINAAMSIAVAGIEADAQKAVAAFDSIGKGIESTGKLLEKLYSSYDNYDGMSWQQIRTIQDAIKKEEAFRAEQFNLQKELITAQIAEMKARTDSFRNGGGLIKIDGAGLQPHLEAFMWEILKTIQVRVNKDGLGLLLGAS